MWSFQFWLKTEDPWHRSWKPRWIHWYGNISWTPSDLINPKSLSEKTKRKRVRKEKTIQDHEREWYEKRNKEKLRKKLNSRWY